MIAIFGGANSPVLFKKRKDKTLCGYFLRFEVVLFDVVALVLVFFVFESDFLTTLTAGITSAGATRCEYVPCFFLIDDTVPLQFPPDNAAGGNMPMLL